MKDSWETSTEFKEYGHLSTTLSTELFHCTAILLIIPSHNPFMLWKLIRKDVVLISQKIFQCSLCWLVKLLTTNLKGKGAAWLKWRNSHLSCISSHFKRLYSSYRLQTHKHITHKIISTRVCQCILKPMRHLFSKSWRTGGPISCGAIFRLSPSLTSSKHTDQSSQLSNSPFGILLHDSPQRLTL